MGLLGSNVLRVLEACVGDAAGGSRKEGARGGVLVVSAEGGSLEREETPRIGKKYVLLVDLALLEARELLARWGENGVGGGDVGAGLLAVGGTKC